MVKKTPGVVEGQKGLESIRYFNVQISKERYTLLPSLIPWKADVPKFEACSECEYFVNHSDAVKCVTPRKHTLIIYKRL